MTPDDPRHPPPGTGPEDAPPSSLDDEASALLEARIAGAAPPPESVPPDVWARASAMEAARTALRQVPAADAGARERSIAAALAAADDEQDPPAAGAGGPATVTDLRSGRHRRPGTGRWVGAAAAAALLAGVIVAGMAGSPSDDTADEATATLDAAPPAAEDSGAGDDRAAESAPESSDGMAEDAPGAAASPQADASARAIVLGDFATADDLLAAAAGLPTARAGAADTSGDTSAEADAGSELATGVRCPAGSAGDENDVPVATGTIDGVTAEVWRTTRPGAERLVALDPSSCTVLAEHPLL
jgi:hypothetical protein